MIARAPVEPGVLGARLRQQQAIEDPQYGELEPLALEARATLWPHPSNWAVIELIAVTEGGARRLEEYRFTPCEGAAVPVAILFERTPNGASRARMYSTPALRMSYPRTLIVDEHLTPGRDPSDVLGRWIVAMHSGDLKAAQALLTEDGTLQGPDGSQYSQPAQRRAALSHLALQSAEALRYHTRLEEGARGALELQLPSGKPALIVGELASGGLLSGLRLYA